MAAKRVLAALILALALGGVLTAVAPTAAHASTTGGRAHALRYALNREGCWYVWGGTGPCSSGYDCSGLVYAAYRSAGITLPRTTYSMLAWSGLRRESASQAREGDLVFYGSGHVELYYWRHVTLGALESGTPVGMHRWYPGSWWAPTEYFHVRGAG